MTLLETITEEINNCGGVTATMFTIMAENPRIYGYGNINKYQYRAERSSLSIFQSLRSLKIKNHPLTRNWSIAELRLLENNIDALVPELMKLLPHRSAIAIRIMKSNIRKKRKTVKQEPITIAA